MLDDILVILKEKFADVFLKRKIAVFKDYHWCELNDAEEYSQHTNEKYVTIKYPRYKTISIKEVNELFKTKGKMK